MVGKMGADEAGAARDQDLLLHLGRFIYPCCSSSIVSGMTPDRLARLPFLWGAATSAHQVEGGDEASDWHDWEQLPAGVCSEPAGLACDHLNRYPGDIRLLADLGLNCYRFSVEGSRIE